MAMQYLDMTGKTEEEAVSRALAQLGLDRDEVSVEILERAKSGFFGIGASPAKVRVTYGLEEEEPVQVQPKAAPKPVKAEAKPAEKAEKQEKPEEESVPAAPKADKPQRKKKKSPAKDKPQRKEQEGEEELELPLPEPEDL